MHRLCFFLSLIVDQFDCSDFWNFFHQYGGHTILQGGIDHHASRTCAKHLHVDRAILVCDELKITTIHIDIGANLFNGCFDIVDDLFFIG